MNLKISRLILYSKNMERTISFYQEHFGFSVHRREGDRIIELILLGEGARLLIHPAGKGIKMGQAVIKLVFDVEDVPSFKEKCKLNGLDFGTIHEADGYSYANAKDPDKNSIQISSRATVL